MISGSREVLLFDNDVCQRVVDRFQSRRSRILLISQAAGEALNLQAASRFWLMAPWYNLSVDEQAIRRCDRPLQTRPVTVRKLLTAKSLDVWVDGCRPTPRQHTRPTPPHQSVDDGEPRQRVRLLLPPVHRGWRLGIVARVWQCTVDRWATVLATRRTSLEPRTAPAVSRGDSSMLLGNACQHVEGVADGPATVEPGWGAARETH